MGGCGGAVASRSSVNSANWSWGSGFERKWSSICRSIAATSSARPSRVGIATRVRVSAVSPRSKSSLGSVRGGSRRAKTSWRRVTARPEAGASATATATAIGQKCAPPGPDALARYAASPSSGKQVSSASGRR